MLGSGKAHSKSHVHKHGFLLLIDYGLEVETSIFLPASLFLFVFSFLLF